MKLKTTFLAAATSFGFAISAPLLHAQSLTYTSGNNEVTAGTHPDPITKIVAKNAGTTVTATDVTVNNLAGTGFLAQSGAALDLTNVTITAVVANYASAIRLEGASSLVADGITASVTSTAALSEQRAVIDLPGGGSATVTNSTLNATGDYTHGVFLTTGSTATVSNTTITTNGLLASGLYAFGSAATGNTITATDVTITTSGVQGYGLYAASNGGGVSGQLNATRARVSTSGDTAFGVYSRRGGQLTVTDSTVETSGAGAHGVRVAPLVVDSTGGLSSITLNNVAVSTSGANAAAYISIRVAN